MIDDDTATFYDALAEDYHLIFADWNDTIRHQGEVLGRLVGAAPRDILDCACGIGTQALGLAGQGHRVTASDLSEAAIARARCEADSRVLDVRFLVTDMRQLSRFFAERFDTVLAADNALPHLDSEAEIGRAVGEMAAVLKPGGRILISIRDYDAIMVAPPSMTEPHFLGENGSRRIVFQVWEWLDNRRYRLHHYITRATAKGWETAHRVAQYRALRRSELSGILQATEFSEIKWLTPEESGYYQPIVVAVKPG